jgi:predicted AAA+ superfamily ATPase
VQHIIRILIHRDISTLIIKKSPERPALLLTGARQTGKSSLLKQLFPEQFYVSLDMTSYSISQLTNGSETAQVAFIALFADSQQPQN